MTHIQVIKKFLQRRYHAEVIILVSSRAVGDYSTESDWDIYIFSPVHYPAETPNELYASLPKSLQDEDLDIYKNTMEEATFPDKLWRDLRNATVLLDNKEKFGLHLKQKAA